MALQRCLGYQGQRCGRLVEGPRCTEHARAVNRAIMASRRVRRPDMRKDEERRAKAVAEYRAVNGNVCPGWGRPPHPATDLTADHEHAVAAGGDERGPLAVLCRSCNSSKRDHAA